LWHAHCLYDLGGAACHLQDYGTAKENLQDALVIYQEIGYDRGQANTSHLLGKLHGVLSELDLAEEMLTRSLELFRRMYDRQEEMRLHVELGKLHVRSAKWEEAEGDFLSALALARQLSRKDTCRSTLQRLHRYYMKLGYPDKAADMLKEAEAM
jgi:tetratricopeptide (TPR) repeat protein